MQNIRAARNLSSYLCVARLARCAGVSLDTAVTCCPILLTVQCAAQNLRLTNLSLSALIALQASGRGWKEAGERAGSLRNPLLSTSWEKKMADKAASQQFKAIKKAAIDVHKEKKQVRSLQPHVSPLRMHAWASSPSQSSRRNWRALQKACIIT